MDLAAPREQGHVLAKCVSVPTLTMPCIVVFAVLLHLKLQDKITVHWSIVLVPLLLSTILTSIPSIIVLAKRQPQATVVQVLFQRIVARKNIINAILRILFLSLVMAKLHGALESVSIRLVTLPIWIQLLVLLIMMQTSVKRLEDRTCMRAFKKHSLYIEIHLLASLFIAMKLDGALSWSWFGIFWPLWVPGSLMN